MNELILQGQAQIEVQVQVHNGVPATTSRNIAEVFCKNHKDVMRDIRNIIAGVDPEFSQRNFAPSDFVSERGKTYQEYLLTRDGAMMLIMSYTGPKAMAIKTAYIKRFNEMEQLLKQRAAPKPAATALPLKDLIEVTKIVLEPAGIEGNQLALALDKVVKTKTGESALTLAGVQLVAPTQEQLLTPTDLGKPLGLSARAVNKKLVAIGYQTKTDNGWELTEAGKRAGGVYLDVGKRHNNGTPVRQLKWPAAVARQL